MLEHALAYAARGWKIFPLRGKEPLVPQGHNEATTDVETIKRWWNRWPGANIGCRTGDGIVVLDVDVKNGKPGLATLRTLFPDGAPETLLARTGTGGFHYWFVGDAPTRHDLTAPKDGIDLQASGAYVVLPPSIHPDTKVAYEWLSDLPMLPLPTVLVELAGVRRAATTSELHGDITENRNVTLVKRAGLLRANGASDEELYALLSAMNQSQCKPPLEEKELRRIVSNATRWEQGEALVSETDLSSVPDTRPFVDDASGTDVGNAARFVRLFGTDVRFNLLKQAFLVWSDTHWEDDLCNARVLELGKQVAESFRRQAPSAELKALETAHKAEIAAAMANQTPLDTAAAREKIEALQGEVKHFRSLAAQLETLKTIKTMVETARTREDIRVTSTDGGHRLYNAAEGTIELDAMRFRPHAREDLLTRVAPVRYQAGAEAPTWQAFLRRCVPDADVRAFLQRAVGYSLTGFTSEQVLFFLHGDGANGKSTFINAIQAMMGPYAAVGAPSLLSGKDNHPTEIADLQGRRMVILNETAQGVLPEDIIKRLTSDEPLKARTMGKDFWSFTPTHKLWILGNHKPTIRGTDRGIWRRICLVPFEQTIPVGERDGKLGEKLLAELPGILNWALAGCRAWQQGGLSVPAVIGAATDAYRAEEDVVGNWLREECVREGSMGAADAYRFFRQWAVDGGFWAMNQKLFSRRLGAILGSDVHKTRSGNVWDGIRHRTTGAKVTAVPK